MGKTNTTTKGSTTPAETTNPRPADGVKEHSTPGDIGTGHTSSTTTHAGGPLVTDAATGQKPPATREGGAEGHRRNEGLAARATPGKAASASETEPTPNARKLRAVAFAKPVKPFQDTAAAYELKSDSRLRLTLEGSLVVATFAGSTAGTTGGCAWPADGQFIREIRFVDVPGDFNPEPMTRGEPSADGVGNQAHPETPQGAGARQATSGEAVSNTGLRGSGRNLPPKEGQSPEDAGHAPDEEADPDER